MDSGAGSVGTRGTGRSEHRRPAGDRGVSTVVGITLVVVITVLLSSAVAGLVFGVGTTEEPQPQASVTFLVDADDDTIRIKHVSGERLYSDRTRIVWELNDTTVRSQPTRAADRMGASQYADFYFNGSSPDGVWSNYSAPGSYSITENTVITVSLYDTETEKRLYTDTFTAEEVEEPL